MFNVQTVSHSRNNCLVVLILGYLQRYKWYLIVANLVAMSNQNRLYKVSVLQYFIL